ncbi:type II toxin-antitoxin system RelB/DinJ family antitoxin [Weissella ceti]|uniref:type II toxin-antitoxin system RelB/DinJ family antitoxin n=1 Tax=Weissella ceti TaxID=759620 RepID=UPI001BD12EA9|nr:type II toxin-antitoxin system RelB/DinJ family antitoxin [Weissella ceti]QVK12609.1 type II toxin-antitoxin system RelB/DinJ family antitoxin [Weissella ceti]
MSEKLLQLRLDSDVKKKADALFAEQGITIQGAIRIMLHQVANTGKTPFDNVFTGENNEK